MIRENGTEIILHRLAELVPERDNRRKLLENIDKIAQGAIDATRTYTNKHGEEVVVETPDWGVALKAQVAGAAILHPELVRGMPQGEAAEPAAVVRSIMKAANDAVKRAG